MHTPGKILSRTDAERLDRSDPLPPLRQHFLVPDGLRYFDGNSLGPLTRTDVGG